MNRRHFPNRESGVALVTTVIVVAVLAVVAVAFMQSTTVDRMSSRSVANYYRAKLAAEAGLADFQATLAGVVATNDFAVVELTTNSTNVVTALVQPQTNGEVQVFPLFSRSNSNVPLVATAPFGMSNLFTVTASVGALTNLNPALVRYGGTDWPATNADSLVLEAEFVVSATNNTGTPAAEFAYVVADDGARLNLTTAGTNYANAARTNPLPSEFSGEIAVHSVGPNTLTAADYGKFKALPDGIRSGLVLPSVFASTNDRKNKARFYTSHQGQAFDLIPAGYFDDARTVFTAHADAGKFKYDLNRMATNSADSRSNAFAIADVIASNLPSFRLRDPSFTNSEAGFRPSDPDLRYARRIAAAIVDYIDGDSIPTRITDDEPAGKEAVAYPFQIAERYDWVSTAAGASPTSWTVTVRQKLFVELWNPYTSSVAGDFRFEFETFREIEPPGGAFVGIPKLTETIQVSLQPNEIKVFEIGQSDIAVTVTGEDPSSNPRERPLVMSLTSSDVNTPRHSHFKAYWNNELFDQTSSYNTALFDEQGSGLARSAVTMTNANTTNSPAWAVNTGQTPVGTTLRAVNDPRQNHINNYVWEFRAYTNTSVRWNGANDFPVNSSTTHKFESTWAQRDGFRAALNIGRNVLPTAEPTNAPTTYEPAQASNAPAFVRNAPMETVAELGHIYDPVHLDNAGANVSGGQPRSFYAAGGGRTLRIGQIEPTNHATLNRAGQRAMNLLDIFTALPPGAPTNAPRAAGLNINTAPVDVLAAFFYNLQPVSDQGLTGGNKISLAGATNVATNIVANRPYYSASDMHRFLNELANKRTNYSPAIAGVPALGGNLAPTPNMHDRAREELFRRAYNSLDTKSGAFRFYGIGRAIGPSTDPTVPGPVLSTAVLEAWVELRATTNTTTGEVFLRPVVTQRKFL